MTKRDDRISLTIAFPSYIPRARGIHAAGKLGTRFKALCTEAEKELVEQAADQAGVSLSHFVRWCCVQAAKEILNVDPVPVQSEPAEQ